MSKLSVLGPIGFLFFIGFYFFPDSEWTASLVLSIIYLFFYMIVTAEDTAIDILEEPDEDNPQDILDHMEEVDKLVDYYENLPPLDDIEDVSHLISIMKDVDNNENRDYYATAYMPRENYKAYLKSTKWKIVRDRVFDRDDNECQFCSRMLEREHNEESKEDEEVGQVHHITYERLGDEQLDDLILLCADCHKEEHEKIDALKKAESD